MIGRTKEINELNRLYESDESEFVAVYGRRRVGKTYLIRETFADRFAFQHTGLPNATKRQQLAHFKESLVEYGFKGAVPKDWFAAFHALKEVVAKCVLRRKVVFIDELPWLDTAKSDFLMALEAFWNEWASARKDIMLVVCGSAAAWMVKNLFRNRAFVFSRLLLANARHLWRSVASACRAQTSRSATWPLAGFRIIGGILREG